MRQEIVARFLAEAGDVERGACRERLNGANRMNATDEAADPFQRRRVFEFGRAAAVFGIHRKTKTAKGGERAAACKLQGRDNRDLALREVAREGMLFEDLRIGPARGAIELCDDRGGLRSSSFRHFVEPHLVHAIFVAVQREQAAVAEQANGAKRVEDAIGRQSGVRGAVIFHQYSTGIGSRLRQRYHVATERHGRHRSAAAYIASRGSRSP